MEKYYSLITKKESSILRHNIERIALYWVIMFVVVLPFYGLSMKSMSASFILAWFTQLLNSIYTEFKTKEVTKCDCGCKCSKDDLEN